MDQTLILGGLNDAGFTNLGLRPMADDAGRGGTTPAAVTGQPFPLSFTLLGQLQALNQLPFETPSLSAPLLFGLATASSPTAVRGTFKTPGIRNVALTAPYFHNGSMDTLQQVVEFYARGGNFPNTADNPTLDAKMHPIGNLRIQGGPGQIDMVNFLNSLTDARVRDDLAPFDHPALDIPSGDPADAVKISLLATGGTPALVTLDTFTMTTLPTTTLLTNIVIGGGVKDSTVNNDVVNVEVDVNGLKNWAIVNRLPNLDWTFTITPLTGLRIGHNTISATASTPTGATTTIPAVMDLLPTALIFGAPVGAINFNNTTMTVGGNGVTSYRYSVDGGAFIDGGIPGGIPTTTPIVVSGLADGPHTLSVVATAMVGTVPFVQPDANATLAQWTVDTVPPFLTVSPVTSPTGATTQRIIGTVELGSNPRVEAGPGVTAGPISIIGSAWSCEVSGLKKGTNNIAITATDIASNVTTATASIDVILPDGCFRGTANPDLTDALKSLRIAVGTDSASVPDMLHGDVAPLAANGVPAPDGTIDVNDALLILKKVVNLVNF
jgi:hypothetical protein